MTSPGGKLSLSSQYIEGTRSFEYEIGRLTEKIDDATAKVLARFMFLLTLSGERPLLGFSLVLQNIPPSISDSGWRTLQERPALQHRLPWVIGSADSMNTFCRMYQLAWNGANNEPAIVVIAPQVDNGAAFAEVERDGDLYPGHEECLLSLYPTVVSRYYDGLWLRVLSRRLAPEDAAELLNKAMDETAA